MVCARLAAAARSLDLPDSAVVPPVPDDAGPDHQRGGLEKKEPAPAECGTGAAAGAGMGGAARAPARCRARSAQRPEYCWHVCWPAAERLVGAAQPLDAVRLAGGGGLAAELSDRRRAVALERR